MKKPSKPGVQPEPRVAEERSSLQRAAMPPRLDALMLRAYRRQAAEVAELLDVAGVPQWVTIVIEGDRMPCNSTVERLRWYLNRRKDVKPSEIDQDLQREMAAAEAAAHEYGKRHSDSSSETGSPEAGR